MAIPRVEGPCREAPQTPDKQVVATEDRATTGGVVARVAEPGNRKHSDLIGQSVLLVGFKGTERASLAAEVQRRGGVVVHTCADATRAIAANESWAESVWARGVQVVQLEPTEDDPRTALECLADLIQADDEEFGPEAVDGEYRVRATVAGTLALDGLTVEVDGRILARLHEGQPCHRYITESEALEVLVAGGHRRRAAGGAA